MTASATPATMKLDRHRTQFLIVDIQEKLAPAVIEHETMILKVNRLAVLAKAFGIPVTVSEHYPKGVGPTVSPIRETVGNSDWIFGKLAFSCMDDDSLRTRFEQLRDGGRDQILLAGMEAHVCITQTALDLAAAGYHTFVTGDAISSRAKSSRELAIARMRSAGCIIVDAEMAMFEWTRQAGTPEFKEMLALIKESAPAAK